MIDSKGKESLESRILGGYKARDKNLKRNPNFYKEIGRKGGLKRTKQKHAAQ